MTYTVVILSCLLVVAVFYAIKFGLIIAKIEEGFEEALDTLDNSYASIGKIIEKPLFFDSAEVRSVLNELRRSQEAILKAASSVASIMQQEEDQ